MAQKYSETPKELKKGMEEIKTNESKVNKPTTKKTARRI